MDVDVDEEEEEGKDDDAHGGATVRKGVDNTGDVIILSACPACLSFALLVVVHAGGGTE